jgi:hypothetical protein
MKIKSYFFYILKKSSIFLVSLLLFSVSCEEADDLTKFDIEYEEPFTVPATLGIDTPISIPTPDITTDYEEKFSGNDTKKDLVEKIFMKELVLSIKSPQEADLSFLKSLTIYINAEGMEETEIASRESISNDIGSTLEMETSGVDLKEYIFKDSFNLRTKVTTDETISEDHEINAAMVFTVDAGLL